MIDGSFDDTAGGECRPSDEHGAGLVTVRSAEFALLLNLPPDYTSPRQQLAVSAAWRKGVR